MKHLAIETSCDESSVAVLEDGRTVLSNIIASQISTHRDFGGVVPEIASRMHVEAMSFVLDEALKKASSDIREMKFISVTRGPGLIGALLVGTSYAKALGYALSIPVVGVNHMLGHICANYISHKDLNPPFISLVVSGGHSYLVDVKDYLDYEVVGRTRDDAVGEAYDKVARVLGLKYPGGPEIEKLADNYESSIDFPRVMLKEDNYDFSFSGLKTAVLNYINEKKQKKEDIDKRDIAASFEEAAIEVLLEKSIKLMHERKRDKIVIAGGVSANTHLRKAFIEREDKDEFKTYYPDKVLCTDNAAMIASAGYFEYINKKTHDDDFKVDPNLGL